MNCSNCNKEFSDEYDFCPNCGAKALKIEAQTYEETLHQKDLDFIQKFKELFKSGTFLAICILVSVSAFFSLFTAFDVLQILTAISLWLIYSQIEKSPISHFRFFKGILTAKIVLSWIAAILAGLSGILFFATSNMITPEIIDEVFETIKSSLDPGEYVQFERLLSLFQLDLTSTAVMANVIRFFLYFLGAIFVFMSIATVFICLHFYKKFRASVDSAITSLEINQNMLSGLARIKHWFVALTVFSSIKALSTVLTSAPLAISAICSVATYVCGIIFISNLQKLDNEYKD